MKRVRKGYAVRGAVLLALVLAGTTQALASNPGPGVWSPSGRIGIACATEVKDPWLRLRGVTCPLTQREGSLRIAWTLYPDAPAPDPSSRRIVVGVLEPWCASARNPVPHLGPPEVQYLKKAVVIDLWIDPPEGAQLCPANPIGRLVVKLPGPLEGRQLYDGGSDPPRKVKPGEDLRRLPYL